MDDTQAGEKCIKGPAEGDRKELLPCPFCGKSGLELVDTYSEEFEGEMVECKCCFASAPSRTWNMRKDDFVRPWLERIHIALQNPSRPRQSIGEMVAGLLDRMKR